MNFSKMSNNVIKSLEKLQFSIGSKEESDVLGGLDLYTCQELSSHMLATLSQASQDTGHIRVIENGMDMHPAKFYDARIGDGLILHSQLKDRVVNKVLERGGTIVIDHVNDISPVAQAIQEYMESVTGGSSWVQCYITQANKSAFNLHQDNHPFVIIQINGEKEWKHLPGSKKRKENIVYKHGDIAFYPRHFSHDVSGLGRLSIHLTIAFDTFPVENSTLDYIRRRGNGLPYSLGYPITEKTASRLSLRKKSWKADKNNKIVIDTGSSLISLEQRYEKILEILHRHPSTRPVDITSELNIQLEEVMQFWELGYRHGLIFNSL